MLSNDLLAPNGNTYKLRRVRAAVNAEPQELVAVNSSAGAVAITLRANVDPGTCLAVGDDAGQAAVNAITVTPGSGTIDGAATYVIATAGEVAEFIYDGSGWHRIISTRRVVDARGASLSYARAAGLGGATAAAPGANQQVVFNDAGAFGADAGLTFNKATGTLSLAGTVTASVVKPTILQLLGVGATPAASGLVRLPSDAQAFVKQRSVSGLSDFTAIYVDGADGLNLGTDNSFAAAQQITNIRLYATTSIALGCVGTTMGFVTPAGLGVYNTSNLLLYGHGVAAPDAGGGAGVFAAGNANTVPNTNPANGCVHYTELTIPKTRIGSGAILKPTHAACLAADFTNAQSAAGGATNLVLPLAAGEVWNVRAGGLWTCSGAGGITIAMIGPAGSAFFGGVQGFGASLAAAAGTSIEDTTTYRGDFCTVGAQDQPFMLQGRVKNGATAGNLVLSIRPFTNGQTARLYAGAWLEATPATEV